MRGKIKASDWLKTKKERSQTWKKFWDDKYLKFIYKQANLLSKGNSSLNTNLVIDGILGALSAMKNFDYDRGAQFGTALWYGVQGKMFYSLKKNYNFQNITCNIDPINNIKKTDHVNPYVVIINRLYKELSYISHHHDNPKMRLNAQLLIDYYCYHLSNDDLQKKYKKKRQAMYYSINKALVNLKQYLYENKNRLKDFLERNDLFVQNSWENQVEKIKTKEIKDQSQELYKLSKEKKEKINGLLHCKKIIQVVQKSHSIIHQGEKILKQFKKTLTQNQKKKILEAIKKLQELINKEEKNLKNITVAKDFLITTLLQITLEIKDFNTEK